MLPLAGMLIALFIDWLMNVELTKSELDIQNPTAYLAWQTLVRYITPEEFPIFRTVKSIIGIASKL
ncbi:MAG: hypothetical protein NPIRA02_18310 [Nitrospirales bacterium]|nr:MAG: hypothetical protein NPIRA02_18310 [Nitrospirales bacterium]